MALVMLMGFSAPTMNTSNPFQIPVCLQRADMEQRRRERFKKAVVTALAATVALLIGLLIEGCVSEHTKTASHEPSQLNISRSVVTPAPVPVITSVSAANKVHPLAPVSAPVPSAIGKAGVPLPVVRPDLLYIVKSGDTLTHIAKDHHTTVKAIKMANGLGDDHIVVGLKLKMPQV